MSAARHNEAPAIVGTLDVEHPHDVRVGKLGHLARTVRIRLTQIGLFLLLGIMAFAVLNDVLPIVG